MAPETQTLVIRIRRPWLRRMLWGAGLAALPLVLYLMYQFGQMDGGHNQLFVWQKRRELLAQIERLEKANAELRVKVAEFETARVSQQQERNELTRNVGELQSQIARQNQDVAFYRGIVDSSVIGPSVRIQRVLISRGSAPGRYRLRVVLIHAGRPDGTVSGSMTLSLRGRERGRALAYPLARVAVDQKEQIPFSFRYFQDIDEEIMLPPEFEPTSVEVEARATGRVGAPLSQSFGWVVQAS